MPLALIEMGSNTVARYVSALHRVDVLLFLLLISTVSAILLKKKDIPYTIGLVPIGILVAWLLYLSPAGSEPGAGLGLNKELIMYVLLPALIFDASLNMDVPALKKELYPTLMLAAPGLVIATVVTGGLMYFLTPLPVGPCMIFGALISATDPVAVISLFEMLGAPKRLRMLMDGESLFNDATAIAMFNVVLAIVLAGGGLTGSAVLHGTFDFCRVFVGGFLVGMVVGYLFSLLMAHAGEDAHIQTALSILLAYLSFLIADRWFEVSGVMAVMAAGILVVKRGFGRGNFSATALEHAKSFWAFMAFLANSAIFLLLGFTEQDLLFHADWGVTLRMIAAAVFAILAARALVVFGMSPALGFREKRIPMSYQIVMFWGGLRGAVPLALIFSIPEDYAYRGQIMQITLAVVLFTLLVPGLTTKPLLRKFGLVDAK